MAAIHTISYYQKTPLIPYQMPYEAYDKRKKIKRPCQLCEYDETIAIVRWEDTRREGKVLLQDLEFKGIIPQSSDILKIGLIIDPIPCWKCHKISHSIYAVEIIYMDTYIQLHTHVEPQLLDKFDHDILKQYQFGEVKERYSKTMQKSYSSEGCFYCDALFGKFYLNKSRMEYEITLSWPEACDYIEILYEDYCMLNPDNFVAYRPDELLQYRQYDTEEVEEEEDDMF